MSEIHSNGTAKKSNLLPIVIIGILFFVFGFVTWLNGTLIPFLKLACDLQTDTQALLVTFAFYMAYFFLSLPSSLILSKTGYKKGMALGLIVMALGAIIFIPAAETRNFNLFLAGLFIQGMGLALLQTASNPYITILGSNESAAKRISIMGICNKVAGAISPIVLSAIVLSDGDKIEKQIEAAADAAARNQLLVDLAQRVEMPYIVMAVILVALAVMIWLSPLPEIDTDKEDGEESATSHKTIFSYPHLWLGVLCIFLYVGVEVMAGDVIGLYGQSMGMKLDQTKVFTSYTLWSMVAGYLLGIATIPKYLKQQTALKIMAVLGIVFATLAWITTGYVSILFIALLGFANSLMWPAIFPLAIKDLGKFTKVAAALLVMGIAGGAIIPQVYGSINQYLQPQTSFFVVVVPCYLYILFFAQWGHKYRKTA